MVTSGFAFFAIAGVPVTAPLQTVTLTRNGRVWPPRSVSVPVSAWSPSASAASE